MTDKELIQQEIDKIQGYIEANRYTGRTYRIANEIIDKFFNEPIGTIITMVDHSDNNVLANMVVDRIKHDFPNIKFRLECKNNKIYTIVRCTPTFKESAYEHIEGWKKRMEDYEE